LERFKILFTRLFLVAVSIRARTGNSFSRQRLGETSALETAGEVQLNGNALAVCLYMPEYFGTTESRARFAAALTQLGDRKLYSLCYTEHFRDAIDSIRSAGFASGRITPLVVPYYSEYTRINMALIRNRPSGTAQTPQEIALTQASGPLPDDQMRAELDFNLPALTI
jgi:hypothetical protein